MSFCRITGKSRGLPKPNYFPLLAPISPADAKRFCRITGRAYGLPSHHYIPVILTTYSSRTKCRITSSKDGRRRKLADDSEYGKRKHMVLSDYRYIFPVFDESDEQQRNLIDLLNSKECDGTDEKFVYRVGERNFGLVFPARLEAAVRDGDVRDVMLAKDSDTMLLKMRQGKNVSVDLHSYDLASNSLFDGEGPKLDVILERELQEKKLKQQRAKRGKGSLLQMANIFESKERVQDEQLLNEVAIQEQKRRKIEVRNAAIKKRKVDFTNEEGVSAMRSECSLYLASGDWRDLVKPVIESWDWDTYENQAQNPDIQCITNAVPTPCQIEAQIIETRTINVDPAVLNGTTGFVTVPCIGNLVPVKPQEFEEFVKSVQNIPNNHLLKTRNLFESLEGNENLPKHSEILEILQKICTGVPSEINSVSGVSVQLNVNRTAFVVGQTIETPTGRVFIPGHTQSTSNGPIFVPGLALNSTDGTTFIPGTMRPSEGNDAPVTFVAGQIVENTFVQGQTMHTTNGDKFVNGQTVVTSNGLAFVPGQVNEKANVFVPGQTMTIGEDLSKFVPGQTVTTADGERFIAGQNTYSEKLGCSFVPGQTVGDKFVAGISIILPEGSKFVPGQYADDIFVPGITADSMEGVLQFTPGLNVETKQGPKFIEGQMVSSQHGHIFMPGKTYTSDEGAVDFQIAKTVHDMNISEATSNDFVIDPASGDISKPSLSVYGHMVQTEKGIEFYPDSINVKNLPSGKIVPGKLIKQDVDSKFVPGIMENGGFIPGQVVWTDKGEQFLPGQVIETNDGLKFVPGQVIETNGGSKFVPGQSVETPEGVRFVPGQIVHTKAGPTFIPGQVIHTEDEGERFVPGQVVDTDDGPRFVPGRVVENGDKVTFIPGQIVQTDDGPRFVAPDLSNIEGEQHFSVQSFLINPEELSLLKSTHTWNTNNNDNSKGELSVDSKMLRQLSEAGMKIGRQIEASAVDIVLQSTRDIQTVAKLAEKMQLSDTATEKLHTLFKELKSVINNRFENGDISHDLFENGPAKYIARIDDQRNTIKQSRSNNNNNDNPDETMQLVDVLVSTLLAVITSDELYGAKNSERKLYNSSSLFELLSDILVNKIAQGDDSTLATFNLSAVDLIAVLRSVETELDKVIHECSYVSKIDMVKATIANSANFQACNSSIENIYKVLDEEPEMAEVVRNLANNDPGIMHEIIANLQNNFTSETTEITVTDLLHQCIVAAVKQSADAQLDRIINERQSDELIIVVKKAVALSKALGHPELSSILASALINTENVNAILLNSAAKEILHRILIMDKLSECQPDLKISMENLLADPYAARKDSTLRELLRQSGVVTIPLPEQTQPLVNSNDVPISILCSENQLAMEDFLLRRRAKTRGAFLIVKDGYQAVVPRELSRDVLTGKCAYTVLDENGIHHFEPLHVFSALKLTAPSVAHRFSIYSCDVANSSDDYVGSNGAGSSTSVTTSSLSSCCDIQLKTKCGDNGIVQNDGNTKISTTTTSENTLILRKRRQIQNYVQNIKQVSCCEFIMKSPVIWNKTDSLTYLCPMLINLCTYINVFEIFLTILHSN